jgi:hypothetical protein
MYTKEELEAALNYTGRVFQLPLDLLTLRGCAPGEIPTSTLSMPRWTPYWAV